jgi:serine-type D-Ala-D-Ala carboxypeptidase/endopeptidase (penicillin-binding protein 4)
MVARGGAALLAGAPDGPVKTRATGKDLVRFSARVERVLAGPPAQKSFVGLLIEDADTGDTLYELNADRYFAPASTTKLFTTSFALSTLGAEYRFRTTLNSSAAPGPGGILTGDLVLSSCGDPSLSNRGYPYVKQTQREGSPERVLAEMVQAAAARGLKQVRGDAVADASCFPNEPFPNGWELEDLKFGYGAAVSAIVVNDNQLSGELSPAATAGAAPTVQIEPDADYFRLTIRAVTAPPGSPNHLVANWLPGSRNIEITGTVPLYAKPVHLDFGNPQPVEFAAALMKHLLEERGIGVSGVARPEFESPGPGLLPAPQILAEHISPPLSDIIAVVNKASENLYAELLLRAAGRAAAGSAALDKVLDAEREFLKHAGVGVRDALLFDGSGLSRRNLVTPRAELTILRYISTHQSWGNVLVASLPVAGEDGTLMNQMRSQAVAGRIHAKTGSLEHSKALAGYATTLSGRHLRFAMFMDNYDATPAEADAALDAIAEAMVEEIGPQITRKHMD